MSDWIVDQSKASQLNLREGVAPARIIAVMDAGTRLRKLGEVDAHPDWWKVTAFLSRSSVRGYVNSTYLAPAGPLADETVDLTPIPKCVLPGFFGRRNLAARWPYPLDPSDAIFRKAPDPQTTLAIIRHLAPDRRGHLRYTPNGTLTYCNIYAHDFCHCMDSYLPRVWWTGNAIAGFVQGKPQRATYGGTATEQRANDLYDWLAAFGSGFGWTRVFEPGELQDAANRGQCALIVARRKATGRSGHIVAVVPEHEGQVAARSKGQVTRPVTSQAGSVNHTAFVPRTQWWRDDRFSGFSFWTHP